MEEGGSKSRCFKIAETTIWPPKTLCGPRHLWSNQRSQSVRSKGEEWGWIPPSSCLRCMRWTNYWRGAISLDQRRDASRWRHQRRIRSWALRRLPSCRVERWTRTSIHTALSWGHLAFTAIQMQRWWETHMLQRVFQIPHQFTGNWWRRLWTPEKAIAIGFACGHIPDKFELKNADGTTTVVTINEDELTDILCAFLSPTRPYGYCFAYSGGAHNMPFNKSTLTRKFMQCSVVAWL